MKNKKIMILMFVLTLFMINVGKVEGFVFGKVNDPKTDFEIFGSIENETKNIVVKSRKGDAVSKYLFICRTSNEDGLDNSVTVKYKYSTYNVFFKIRLLSPIPVTDIKGLESTRGYISDENVHNALTKYRFDPTTYNIYEDAEDSVSNNFYAYDKASISNFEELYGNSDDSGSLPSTCVNGFVVVDKSMPSFNIFGVKGIMVDVKIELTSDQTFNELIYLSDLDYRQEFAISKVNIMKGENKIAEPDSVSEISEIVKIYDEVGDELAGNENGHLTRECIMETSPTVYKCIISSSTRGYVSTDSIATVGLNVTKIAGNVDYDKVNFRMHFYSGPSSGFRGQSHFYFGNLVKKNLCVDDLEAAKATNDILEYFKLYNKYKQKGKNYNGLLDFSDPKCERINVKKKDDIIASCDSKLKFAINQVLKAREITSTNENKVSFEDAFAMEDLDGNSIFEKIGRGDKVAYCKYDYETVEDDTKIESGVKVFSGQTLWSVPVIDPIFKMKITQTCRSLVDKNTLNGITEMDQFNNYDLAFEAKDKNGKTYEFRTVNGTTNFGDWTSCSATYCVSERTSTKFVSVYYGPDNWLHYNNGFSGGIKTSDWDFTDIETELNNIINQLSDGMIKLGFSTKIDEELEKAGMTFIMKKKHATLKTTSCKYSTKCQLVDCPDNPDDPDEPDDGTKKLNLEFRIIDTNEPFPGKDGHGRETGSNWCEPTADISVSDVRKKYLECNDLLGRSDVSLKEKRECYLAARNDLESIANGGLNCDKNNEMVKTYITNRNNSYNIKNKEPLISVTLDSISIKNIREYNQGKSYVDNSLTCTNGEECKSSFVTKLLNNEYGQENGSCVGGDTRTYCVGG